MSKISGFPRNKKKSKCGQSGLSGEISLGEEKTTDKKQEKLCLKRGKQGTRGVGGGKGEKWVTN